MENKRFKIDIDEVLKAKVKKKLPKFLVNFLKRRIHQDEINDCIEKAEHPQGVGFFDEALNYLDIKYEVRGAENLDPSRRCIFASNHPIGGPEALIMGSVMRRYYGESFRVPVNNILAHFHPLAEFFVPINMGGRQTKEISEGLTRMFESPYQVLVYPAGKCARKEHDKVTEQPWKKMFITQSRKYERDVVPVHMSGYNSRLFMFLTSFSKFIGLKFNIGMFMLVDELFKKQHKSFVITFGKPIPYSSFDKSKTDQQWAKSVKQIVENLQEGNGQDKNM
ncbi:MAG: glycerol acyltransferase [Paludibacteraceae bacterium]|nr:glycerol acyltransferase [Muribaculaceae bacterium]MBP3576240.1 glycerol acyltransferase [Paludibacteraceae bacterium]